MSRIIGALALSFAIVGCASDVANRYYGQQTYPPKVASEVKVLDGAPSRPYVVIADLQGRHESVSDLREQAAQIGADAVLVARLGGYASVYTNWAGRDPYSGSDAHIVGTAIKYK
ncbi:MAG TPA: hypothetical protein VHW69_11850 [Rhizomicrobium sp.]|jgi:uncharacterized protein YbjQ (UPF0145 family)|nr:hypothetical protein [Rhizomicrobium sp.]